VTLPLKRALTHVVVPHCHKGGNMEKKPSEMKQMGDIEERIQKLTQGHFTVPLTSSSQIDALEQLIGPAPTLLPVVASSGSKSCTKRRARKRLARKTRHRRN
jgi:hypothetical protein